LLDTLFGSQNKAARLLEDLEDLIGVKLSEVWIFRFVQRAIAPVVLAGLVLGWFSTCFCSIPLGSRGVLISLGRFHSQALVPGLHVTLPWPFQEVVSIQTERLREISLGFDKDLSNAVLWTEKHVEGEKSLLIENGESLLAINVPIFYRISDVVTYVKATTDAESALRNIAERKLAQIAAIHESFHFMTEDRQAIANALKQGVQAEVDRFGLGLEITYVGLKDIHPPVSVAPAYQGVESAQEQMEAAIDNAKAYEARTLPLANSQAQTMTIAAESEYTKRVSQSKGEAARFESIILPEAANAALFRLRLRYDALDETLATPAKIIVGIPAQASCEYFLDLRPGASAAIPGGIPVP
jgi:membrane protease subunit HflK